MAEAEVAVAEKPQRVPELHNYSDYKVVAAAAVAAEEDEKLLQVLQ